MSERVSICQEHLLRTERIDARLEQLREGVASIMSSVNTLNEVVPRIEQQLKDLTKLADRVREAELGQARLNARVAILMAAGGGLGAFICGVAVWLCQRVLS